jgi:hypothetical protein
MKIDGYVARQNVTINSQKEQKKELVVHGTFNKQAGHVIWEINIETGVIIEAEYDKIAPWHLNGKVEMRLKRKDDCVYIPALNIKNAIKKYLKDNNQSAYYVKTAPSSLCDII